MTDQELIKALRYCYDGEGCKGCLHQGDNENCMNVNPITAADRLEALMAENAELNIQIQKEIVKRVDVEAENKRLRSAVKKLWCGKRYGEDAVTPSTEEVE